MLADTLAERVMPAAGGSWSADGARFAFVRGGNVFVAERDGRERQITDTGRPERNPHFSRQGRTVHFLSGNDVYAVDLDGGPFRQLVEIRTENEPRDRDPEGQRGFLHEQQEELFEVIRDRARERERREVVEEARTRVPRIHIGQGRSLGSAEVSQSGRYLLITVSERANADQTMVPNFVTEDGYVAPLNARPKVGDAVAGQQVGIVDLESGELSWFPFGEEDEGRTVTAAGWSPTEDRALLLTVSLDYKNRWIHTLTPDLESVEIEHLHDEAWVGGPGLFTLGWLPDGRDVYFVSERTGWAHLYRAPATGGPPVALTEGPWEVHDVQLSHDGRTFHLTTSETHLGERQLFAMPATGGERTRITPGEGFNQGTVSPDGSTVAVLRSTRDRPEDLFLMPATPGATPERITISTTQEFLRGPWIRPQVLTYEARDGEHVYARIYRPAGPGREPNGAAVIFVHGAGYLQNAQRVEHYYREYMFHHLLASRGYTVLDIDYRGSAGYGRDWRTGIYRHMGGKDLTDHVDARRWLVANEGVDPARIGIYGGSYGGFITLMALFTEPEDFRAGAALRSVTDWAHYNHGYTAASSTCRRTIPRRTAAPRPSTSPRGCAGPAAHHPRHGRHQRPLPGRRAAGAAADRARQDELGAGGLPGGGPRLRRADSWADQYRPHPTSSSSAVSFGASLPHPSGGLIPGGLPSPGIRRCAELEAHRCSRLSEHVQRPVEPGARSEGGPAEHAGVDLHGAVQPVADLSAGERPGGDVAETGHVPEADADVDRDHRVLPRHERHAKGEVHHRGPGVLEVEVPGQRGQRQADRVRVLHPRPDPHRRATHRVLRARREQAKLGLAAVGHLEAGGLDLGEGAEVGAGADGDCSCRGEEYGCAIHRSSPDHGNATARAERRGSGCSGNPRARSRIPRFPGISRGNRSGDPAPPEPFVTGLMRECTPERSDGG
jgi:dipeptidyl aminopeptidase/acylaminoacyl peptidase